MEIYPAIDLVGNRVVRVPHRSREMAIDVGDPLDVTEYFRTAGAPRLHVVDVDSVFDGQARHLDLVREVAQRIPVQLYGMRTRSDLEAALVAGVDRLVVDVELCSKEPGILDDLPAETLVVAMDVRNGQVMTPSAGVLEGATPRQFALRMAASGVRRALCTAVHREGARDGPDFDLLREVIVPGLAIIAAGGISHGSHLRALRSLPGVEAVVIGRAFHDHILTYAEAREVLCC